MSTVADALDASVSNPDIGKNGSLPSRGGGTHYVTILELAEKYAHLPANPCTGPWDDADRTTFDAALASFAEHTGAGVDNYFFCVNLPAGAVYSSDDTIQLTYPPDAWAPQWLAELLMQCQMLYVEVRHAPLWSDRRVCLRALYDVMTQLLRMMGDEDYRSKRSAREAALLSQHAAHQIPTIKTGHDCDFEIGSMPDVPHKEWHEAPWTQREKAYREQLARALQIIERSALKYAQFLYFGGMLAALPILVPLAWVVSHLVGGMGFSGVDSVVVNMWLVAAAAGAAGAIVSVMQRISADDCPLRWRAGAWMLFLMGGFRPTVGAVFAVFAVLAFQAQLVPLVNLTVANGSVYFAGVVAFLAGFSERFARDMLAAAPAQLSIPSLTPVQEGAK
jgi:hypothetical protein